MIFRRVKSHIEKENWFAVFVDFCIVVFGVFIGVQVGNWNENRLDRRVYNEAFERVIVEMNTNIRSQKFLRNGVLEELPIIQLALEDLRTCRTDETALANVKAALIPLSSPYAMSLETSALDQLVNNEDFLQYHTPEQRQSLSEMLRRFTFVKKYSDLSLVTENETYKKMDRVLRPGPLNVEGPDDILKVILADNPLSPPLYREPTLAVPLAQACQDKDFLAGFYEWEGSAFRHSINAGRIDKLIRDSLNDLGRPAEPAEADLLETAP